MAGTTDGLLRLQAALTRAAHGLPVLLEAEGGDGQASDGPRAGGGQAADVEVLARRQRYLDALLETIEVGIVACDAEGRFVVSNKAERSMFGLAHSIDGRPMGHLGPRIDVYEDGRRLEPDEYPLMRALRGDDLTDLEVQAGPRGGPLRTLLIRGRQITDDDGRVLGAVAALTDVTMERAAARQLAEDHRRLREAQRLGRLGSFAHDFASGGWMFTEHVGPLLGLAEHEVSNRAILGLIEPADRGVVAAAWEQAATTGQTQTCEVRVRRGGDGAERLFRVSIEVERDATGQAVWGRGTLLDITEVSAAKAAAQRATAFFDAVLTATPDPTFVLEVRTGNVLYASLGKELLGRPSSEAHELGLAGVLELVHPDDRHLLQASGAKVVGLADGQLDQCQYRARHVDGSLRWLSQRLTPFRRDDAGRVLEVLAVVRDVTEVVDAQERLLHAARHDYLTGLPNRVLLVERLEAALRRPLPEQRELAVLFCDLDGFKSVNDLGGHAVGDAVLVEVARRLVAVVRDGDAVARIGGDEFVILVEPWHRSAAGAAPTSDRRLAHRVAARVVDVLGRPIVVDDASYQITASTGIAYARVGGANADRPAPPSAEDLLHRADMAMYQAKQHGKGHVEVFDL